MNTQPSLPHDREFFDIMLLCKEAYEDPNYLAVVITDTREHARFLINIAHRATGWDVPDTKLHREGIEVKGGGRVVFRTVNDPGMLMGLKPTKVVFAGRIGEMYYHVMGMQCPIEAIA